MSTPRTAAKTMPAVTPTPCPNCGHCPTCGHTPYRLVPYTPYYPHYPHYPRYPYVLYPYWVNPNYPTYTITTQATSNSNVTDYSFTTAANALFESQ